MRDHIFFYLNGKPLSICGEVAFLPLADFLRQERGLTGTKIACGEGACGSCTVLIGEPSGSNAAPLSYRPVNACLPRVYQADCRHVVTVEGMGDAGGGLSPVQRALAENNGAQCGFCTPGIVASLTLLAGGGPLPCAKILPPDPVDVREALSGNLCRCTGYLPIYRSAEKIALPADDWRDPYPSAQIAQALTQASGATVRITAGDRALLIPATLGDAVSLYAEEETAAVVAGGTDPGSESETFLSVSRIPELRSIAREEDALQIGAAVTWAELAESAQEIFPELARFLGQFGSPQIRALGTVGGAVAASAYNGDVLPLFLIQNATVTLQSLVGGTRELSYADFLQKGRCRSGELLIGVRLPLPAPGERLMLYKVRRRQAFDRSVFCAAVALCLSTMGETITEARIAVGGIGSLPMRLSRAEEVLIGAPFTPVTMQAAGNAAAASIRPHDDSYASAEYRRHLMRNLPMRVYHDLTTAQTGEGEVIP